MTPQELVKKSKRLSLVLRHNPGSVGLTLDDAGWVEVGDLLRALHMTQEQLDQVVAENNKKRFEYDEKKTRIRASQGHSVDVDLGYEETLPPPCLYHGTTRPMLPVILREGLLKMGRHHVHLSADEETAMVVARRRPQPVLLVVDSDAMVRDGLKFYRSTNGVWLTDNVPAKYLRTA